MKSSKSRERALKCCEKPLKVSMYVERIGLLCVLQRKVYGVEFEL
ncbi:MAG: hypothetical protein ABJK37_16290 [Paraglaciecola sp.]